MPYFDYKVVPAPRRMKKVRLVGKAPAKGKALQRSVRLKHNRPCCA